HGPAPGFDLFRLSTSRAPMRDEGFIPLRLSGEGDGALLDVEGPRTTTSLRYRRVPLAAPEEQLRVLDAVPVGGGPSGTGSFDEDLRRAGWPVLRPARLEIFQINVGKLCNMTCRHC